MALRVDLAYSQKDELECVQSRQLLTNKQN